MAQNDPRATDQRGRTRDSERTDKERELMPDETPELEDTNLDDTAEMVTSAKGSRASTGSSTAPRMTAGGSGSPAERERNESDRTNRGGTQQTQKPQNNPSGGGGWRESDNTGSQTGSTQGSSQRGNQPRRGE